MVQSNIFFVKIEQLIVQYLYLSKQVTLQGIGTFKLSPFIILPEENAKDKDFIIADNAFQFDYNLKAVEDEGLVKYIVQHTNKILPLASADLDSYVMLAKQFLNIGKPLVINGVGTIQKNQQGIYQFSPGAFITPKISDIPKQARETRDETVSFESEGRVNNSQRNLKITVAILIVFFLGLGGYYLVNVYNENHTSISNTEPLPVLIKKDTVSKKVIDSAINKPVMRTIDSSGFKIVLKNFSSKEGADKAFNRLSNFGHKLLIIKIDSIQYGLAIVFKNPLSDTLRAKDSLRKFFGGKPYVQL